MFRSAVLRSLRVAARPAAIRSFAAPVAPRVASVAVPKIQSFQGVRFYSAGGALNKEEVEGRIMSLLQGFDKVRLKKQLGEI
jgi:NADH dehydrogenase (ubiquinone) 1 alpha/beta subcomplex 1